MVTCDTNGESDTTTTTKCKCNAGYFGDGLTCTEVRASFLCRLFPVWKGDIFPTFACLETVTTSILFAWGVQCKNLGLGFRIWGSEFGVPFYCGKEPLLVQPCLRGLLLSTMQPVFPSILQNIYPSAVPLMHHAFCSYTTLGASAFTWFDNCGRVGGFSAPHATPTPLYLDLALPAALPTASHALAIQASVDLL